MHARFIPTLLIGALFLVSGDSLAATLHVTKWGVDSDNCGGKSAPCLTISQAVENARRNDTVLAGPGIYRENVLIDDFLGGAPIAPRDGLKLLSVAGRNATTVVADMPTFVLWVNQDRVQVGKRGRGFTFDGTGGGTVGILALGEKIRIEGNRVKRNANVGMAVNGARPQIRHNVAFANSGSGITCENCDRGLVQDNVAYFNANGGYSISGNGRVTVMRNVARSNGGGASGARTGFFVGGATANNRIKDNVAFDSGQDGFIFRNEGGGVVQGNISSLSGGNGNSFGNGFDLDYADSAEKTTTLKNNIAIANRFSGFWISDFIGRLDGNTAYQSGGGGDGFEFVNFNAVFDLRSFAGNNSAANGTGVTVNNGEDVVHQRLFLGNDTTDTPSGTLDGSLTTKPNPIRVNRAGGL